jgi:hypothetical protein
VGLTIPVRTSTVAKQHLSEGAGVLSKFVEELRLTPREVKGGENTASNFRANSKGVTGEWMRWGGLGAWRDIAAHSSASLLAGMWKMRARGGERRRGARQLIQNYRYADPLVRGTDVRAELTFI